MCYYTERLLQVNATICMLLSPLLVGHPSVLLYVLLEFQVK